MFRQQLNQRSASSWTAGGTERIPKFPFDGCREAPYQHSWSQGSYNGYYKNHIVGRLL